MDEACRFCNWSPHLLSAHETLCQHGHPLDIVGRYGNGRCRACQRIASKKWRDANIERARETWRRWACEHKPRQR